MESTPKRLRSGDTSTDRLVEKRQQWAEFCANAESRRAESDLKGEIEVKPGRGGHHRNRTTFKIPAPLHDDMRRQLDLQRTNAEVKRVERNEAANRVIDAMAGTIGIVIVVFVRFARRRFVMFGRAFAMAQLARAEPRWNQKRHSDQKNKKRSNHDVTLTVGGMNVNGPPGHAECGTADSRQKTEEPGERRRASSAMGK
ncbi:MAG: hypothetical protein WCL32_24900, partial [Planctomycetota bacterium]